MRFLEQLRRIRRSRRLPLPAKGKVSADRAGLPRNDPGSERIIREGIAWLGRAQDCSATRDGGVARHFSLLNGWGASYPETTGYIIPTMLAYAREKGEEGGKEARSRARRMLDWIVSIQFPAGGFQGGVVNAEPRVPVTFNTGQILLGLAAGVQEFGEVYRDPMRRAGDWLCETQDSDGCWRRFPTPFAAPGEKTYETHVAWGLLEAAKVEPGRGYEKAALANIRWALRHQTENGWLDHCCLEVRSHPLTHTIGYALRGMLEGYLYSGNSQVLDAARRTADGVLSALTPEGFLPGRLDCRWKGNVGWACLTGTVQIAHCWLLLFRLTGDVRYRAAGLLANAYVRRCVDIDGTMELRGAVKGSFPIDGDYGRFQYLNWACKFCIDSNMVEREILGGIA